MGIGALGVAQLRLVIKVGDADRALMLGDKGADGIGQAVLTCQFETITNVVFDDGGALVRIIQLVVGVGRTHLVFDEILRHQHFANVVIKGAGMHKFGIEVKFLGSAFG